MEDSEDSIFSGIGRYRDVRVQLSDFIFRVLVDCLETVNEGRKLLQSVVKHSPVCTASDPRRVSYIAVYCCHFLFLFTRTTNSNIFCYQL
jgi:hypothetical protein